MIKFITTYLSYLIIYQFSDVDNLFVFSFIYKVKKENLFGSKFGTIYVWGWKDWKLREK